MSGAREPDVQNPSNPADGGATLTDRAAARVVALPERRPGLPVGEPPDADVEGGDGAGSPAATAGFVLPSALSIRPWTPPVSGALAAIFGVTALFKMAWILAPLAIVLAIIAGLRGHHGWAVIGLGTAIVGLLISPWFWTFLGLAWLYQMWG
ncbi:MAG: hypothetical protein SGJ07_00195 [Rhodospirillaceae bacterium]|nr:hypothetical protein [Rhodospirillaceae bacterium]